METMTLSEINMKLAQTCSNCQDCNVNNSYKMFDVVSIMLLSVYKMQLRDAVLTFIHIHLFNTSTAETLPFVFTVNQITACTKVITDVCLCVHVGYTAIFSH